MELTKRIRQVSELPKQVQTSIAISVAAIVIALVAIGIALGGRK